MHSPGTVEDEEPHAGAEALGEDAVDHRRGVVVEACDVSLTELVRAELGARRGVESTSVLDARALPCRARSAERRAVLTGHGVDVLCSELNAQDDQDGVEHGTVQRQAWVRSTVRPGVIPKRRDGGKGRPPSFVSTRRALSSTAVRVYRSPSSLLLDHPKSVRHQSPTRVPCENDSVDRQERHKNPPCTARHPQSLSIKVAPLTSVISPLPLSTHHGRR